MLKSFTNHLGWICSCRKKKTPLRGEISFKGNKVHRLSGLISGWGFKGIKDLHCLFRKPKTDFRIRLENNPFICDCMEHNILLSLKTSLGRRSQLMLNLKCQNPVLGNLQMDQISLTDLVCHVKKDCPESCTCHKNTTTLTIDVHCLNSKLHLLPDKLPTIPDPRYRYRLFFRDNRIKTEYRSYLSDTIFIDVSNNGLDNITSKALQALENASTVYLHKNHLSALPCTSFNSSKWKILTLYGNTWSCDCTAYELKNLVLNLHRKGTLQNIEDIQCHYPKDLRSKQISQLDESVFVCSERREQENLLVRASVVSILVTILLTMIPVLVVYCNRIWIYTNLHWHPFGLDECDGEEMQYDIFISYADNDEPWVNYLVALLENVHNYTCCHHRRDFVPGEQIIENIRNAIEQSKRTLCIITPDFMQSNWCVFEFMEAYNADAQNNRGRLIAIKRGPVLDVVPENAKTIRQYMSRYNFLDVNDSWFDKKLLYVMPVKKIKEQPQQMEQGEENEETCLLNGLP